jgi:hypothetical protein
MKRLPAKKLASYPMIRSSLFSLVRRRSAAKQQKNLQRLAAKIKQLKKRLRAKSLQSTFQHSFQKMKSRR